jgi:hypothetical protein
MENKLENTTETTKEFTYQFLERITDDFSKERIVGRGGFGIVYKVIFVSLYMFNLYIFQITPCYHALARS